MNHHSKIRKLALLTVLTSLCLAIQLTPRPPNAEFTSLFTFIVGIIYGILNGALFGCFIMFVNCFFSPYSFAGLNAPFQMIGMAIAGILGGIYRNYLSKNIYQKRFCLETAILGGLIAIIFDLITNCGWGVSFILSGMNPTLAFFTALASGTPLAIIHTLSNIIVFGVLTAPLVKILDNMIKGEGFWLKKEPSYLHP
ncbi:ECF transporter S component [Candidatus Bathyarchaeota archaeon]|nr:ECF transporter S component [Candidatus Bathyarchaeota archaeon]